MLLNSVLKQAIPISQVANDASNVSSSSSSSSSIASIQTLRGGDVSHTTNMIAATIVNLIQDIIRRLLTIPTKIHIGLFVFYWLVLGNIVIPRGVSIIVSSLSSPQKYLYRPFLVREMIATLLWAGFVLAISGMEAWVKFRAPFCPRAYKLDIGRTIFPALNAVELAFCLTCWQQHISIGRLLAPGSYYLWTGSASIWTRLVGYTFCSIIVTYYASDIPLSLILVTIILALDMVWLTPKLVQRGKQVVYQYLKDHQKGRGEDAAIKEVLSSKEFVMLENEMKTQDIPKEDKTHVIYVILEFVKLLALGHLILSLALSDNGYYRDICSEDCWQAHSEYAG